LVTADAKVSQDAIHFPDFLKAEKPGKVAEIVGEEPDPAVIRKIISGVRVLIEGDHLSCRPQALQDLSRVSTATESAVYVNTFPAYLERVH
jgi:hypothetical protein